MFRFIVRPFRSIHRSMVRTPIDKRREEMLSATLKSLLLTRSAVETEESNVTLYGKRVDRLKSEIDLYVAKNPKEKRRFDWMRFDNNTLLTAMRDDLYGAEKALFDHQYNLEHHRSVLAMLEDRELRLNAELNESAYLANLQAARETSIPPEGVELVLGTEAPSAPRYKQVTIVPGSRPAYGVSSTAGELAAA